MNGLVSERKGLVLTVEEGIIRHCGAFRASALPKVGTYGSEGHF